VSIWNTKPRSEEYPSNIVWIKKISGETYMAGYNKLINKWFICREFHKEFNFENHAVLDSDVFGWAPIEPPSGD